MLIQDLRALEQEVPRKEGEDRRRVLGALAEDAETRRDREIGVKDKKLKQIKTVVSACWACLDWMIDVSKSVSGSACLACLEWIIHVS